MIIVLMCVISKQFWNWYRTAPYFLVSENPKYWNGVSNGTPWLWDNLAPGKLSPYNVVLVKNNSCVYDLTKPHDSGTSWPQANSAPTKLALRWKTIVMLWQFATGHTTNVQEFVVSLQPSVYSSKHFQTNTLALLITMVKKKIMKKKEEKNGMAQKEVMVRPWLDCRCRMALLYIRFLQGQP